MLSLLNHSGHYTGMIDCRVQTSNEATVSVQVLYKTTSMKLKIALCLQQLSVSYDRAPAGDQQNSPRS